MTEAAEDYNSGEAKNRGRTPFPPYFKAPKAIFHVGLSPYEIAIYVNLSKRADDEGECWPSEPTIAKDTGIRSVKTVRKGLRSLNERGFIVLVSPPGSLKKSATYRVCPFAVEAVAKALVSGQRGASVLSNSPEHREVIPTHNGSPEISITPAREAGVNNVGMDPAKKVEEAVLSTGEGGTACPGGRYDVPVRGVQNTYKGRLSKEDSIKEDTEKEKESPPFCGAPPPQGDSALVLSGESTLSPSPALRKIPSAQESLLTKTNRYYHALSQTEKETFDREARRIRRSKSMPSLVELRELRSKFFGLIQFAQQTYFPSAETLRIATVVLDEFRDERMRELESAHT